MVTEFQLICDGKGKPQHGTNRIHKHRVKDLPKAIKARDRKNEYEQQTPLLKECVPWHIERRTVTNWERIT